MWQKFECIDSWHRFLIRLPSARTDFTHFRTFCFLKSQWQPMKSIVKFQSVTVLQSDKIKGLQFPIDIFEINVIYSLLCGFISFYEANVNFFYFRQICSSFFPVRLMQLQASAAKLPSPDTWTEGGRASFEGKAIFILNLSFCNYYWVKMIQLTAFVIKFVSLRQGKQTLRLFDLLGFDQILFYAHVYT